MPVVVIVLTAFTISPNMLPSLRTVPEQKAPMKKSCTGYEVIEVDKGIDCHGDTIRLIKKNGFFEIAANQ